jgi:hypothetical protein
MIGLLLMRNRHIKFAAIFLALAGQQNPPVLLLLPIAFLIDFVQLKTEHFVAWKRFILSWLGLGVVAAMAIIFSLYQFGVPNLIAFSGWTDSHLISLDRTLSLYFNPNTGGFFVVPMLLAGIIALPFCLFRMTSERSANVKWALLFALMSIILAIPSTAAGNFNPGLYIIHRYSYWILIPIIMLFGEMMQSIFLHRNMALAVLMVGQILLTAQLYDSQRSFLGFTRTELILLNNFPELYNPIPEILFERSYREETFIRESKEGDLSLGFYFWIYHGQIRKVLFQKKDMTNRFPLCLDQSTLRSHRTSKKRVEQNWQYWNIGEGCKTHLADGLSFQNGLN